MGKKIGEKMTWYSCWECGKEYFNDFIFDIPVFKKGFEIHWCFNCAKKQLAFSDYKLIKKKVVK